MTYDQRTGLPRRISSAVFVAATAYGVTFPFIATRLELWGTSGALIGLNAAMPALGWFLGSFLLPKLQSRLSMPVLLVLSLVAAIATWSIFFVASEYWLWTPIRFLFGGAVGLFFRAIEFGINTISTENSRGRVFSIYTIIFGLGIALGALLQPLLSDSPVIAFTAVSIGFVIAIYFSLGWHIPSETRFEPSHLSTWKLVAGRAPLPLLVACVYGYLEDIPAYLLSVYAMRKGLDVDIASYTLAAAAIGSVTLPFPLGVYSDKFGRRRGLAAAAVGAFIFTVAMPWTVFSPFLFLGVIGIWGGFVASLYSIALAMIGDQWQRSGLVTANAAFGATYAAGGLVGPLVNGMSIDAMASEGLIVSASIAIAVLLLVFAAIPLHKRMALQ